jgi:hypothetical protein
MLTSCNSSGYAALYSVYKFEFSNHFFRRGPFSFSFPTKGTCWHQRVLSIGTTSVNTQLFDDWFLHIFLPALAHRRITQASDGPVVLFLDQCFAHQNDRFLPLCADNNVKVCYFPPHSSNQLQPLGLCLFGVTKRLLTRTNRLEAMNIQTKHIARVFCSFLAAAVPIMIVKTFMLTGICLVKDGDHVHCTVRPDQARRLLVPPESCPPDIENSILGDSDEEEVRTYLEECADLLYNLDSDQVSEFQQTRHFLLVTLAL